MAFKMNYQTNMGISLLDTYCYVHKIGGGKELLYIQGFGRASGPSQSSPSSLWDSGL
jgi:hypothetical protein